MTTTPPDAEGELRAHLEYVLHAYYRSVTGDEVDEFTLTSVYPLPIAIQALEQRTHAYAAQHTIKVLESIREVADDKHNGFGMVVPLSAIDEAIAREKQS